MGNMKYEIRDEMANVIGEVDAPDRGAAEALAFESFGFSPDLYVDLKPPPAE